MRRHGLGTLSRTAPTSACAASARRASEAFEQAALALTAVVADPARVGANSAIEIRCEAPDDELLLADWLNALVYEMATRGMLFGRFDVRPRRPCARSEGVGRAARPATASARGRGQGGDVHRAVGGAPRRRHVGRAVRRRCLSARPRGAERRRRGAQRSDAASCRRAGTIAAGSRGDGSGTAEAHRRLRVAAPADGADARARRDLCGRGADPRHGRQGPRAGRQRRHAAGHRQGVVRDARCPLGLRLPDRRRRRVRSGRRASSRPAASASTSPAACARC